MTGVVLPWPHGTLTGYRTHGCRCRHCTATHSRACTADRATRLGKPLPPGDPRHGVYGYGTYGCRCDTCRAAKREANAAANARRRAAR